MEWGRINDCGGPPDAQDWVFPVPGSLEAKGKRKGRPRIRNRGSHYTFPSDISKATGGRIRRFHDLRHTSATLLLEAGASPVGVQRQLRHSRFAVTDKYLNMRPSWLQDEVSRLTIGLSFRGKPAAAQQAAAGGDGPDHRINLNIPQTRNPPALKS
jgi:hypothetical protein